MLVAGTMILGSCSARRAAINDLESFVVQIEKNGETYTMDDWETALIKYAEIEDNLEKHEYTAEEKKEIKLLRSRLINGATESVLISTKKGLENIDQKIDQKVDDLMRVLFE